MPEDDQPDFTRFVEDLGKAIHGAGLKLMVALPAADWSYDYKTIAEHSDAIILMNYDEHWQASPPGPIVAQDWFVTNIHNILKIVPPEKLVMGIANYGYDWPAKSKKVPHPIATCRHVSSKRSSPPRNPKPTSISIATRSIRIIPTRTKTTKSTTSGCSTRSPHTTNCAPRNAPASRAPLSGVSVKKILRSGTIWDATHPTKEIRDKLADVPPGYDLILEGNGDIWRITATPQSGHRTFDFDDSTNLFTDENFDSYPAFLANPADGRCASQSGAVFRRWT